MLALRLANRRSPVRSEWENGVMHLDNDFAKNFRNDLKMNGTGILHLLPYDSGISYWRNVNHTEYGNDC